MGHNPHPIREITWTTEHLSEPLGKSGKSPTGTIQIIGWTFPNHRVTSGDWRSQMNPAKTKQSQDNPSFLEGFNRWFLESKAGALSKRLLHPPNWLFSLTQKLLWLFRHLEARAPIPSRLTWVEHELNPPCWGGRCEFSPQKTMEKTDQAIQQRSYKSK